MKIVNNNARRHGFALVVALGLMAFVLVLLVSISALIQVEVRSSNQSQKLTVARENAVLGAMVALGELNRYTGPDQRITARADIMSELPIANPYWTGVWQSNPSSGGATAFERGEPRWLVSAADSTAEIDPEDALDPSGSIVLAGAVLANGGLIEVEQVEVEKVEIKGQNNQRAGSYAWWVSDEGIKANVKVQEPELLRAAAPESLSNLSRTSMAHRVGWRSLFGEDDSSPANDLDPDVQNRLIDLANLDLVSGNYPALRRSLYHDLTTYSQGVLSNVAEGGLKLDLTRIFEEDFAEDPNFADNVPLFDSTNVLYDGIDIPRWGLLRSFYNLPLDSSQPDLDEMMGSATVRPQTDQQHGIYPLIGMVQFNIASRAAVHPIDPSAPEASLEYPLEVIFQPVVTLVNPYNVELKPQNYTIRVDIEDTSSDGALWIKWTDNGGGADQFARDEDSARTRDLFGESDGVVEIHISSIGFQPGESILFTLASTGEFLGPGQGGLTMQAVTSHANYDPFNFVWIEHPAGKTFSFAEKYGFTDGGPNLIRTRSSFAQINMELLAGSQLLQKIEHIISGTSPVLRSPLNNDDGNLDAAAWFRVSLRDSTLDIATNTAQTSSGVERDLTNGARWMTDYNLRAVSNVADPSHSWGYPNSGGGRGPYGGNMLYTSWGNSGELIDLELDLNTDRPRPFWGPDNHGSFGRRETHVTLFDIPRVPLVSIGALQHANVSPVGWLPAYAIGNSWASPLFAANEEDFSYHLNSMLWDQFFFSTVDSSRSELPDQRVGDPLPNSRIVATPNAEVASLLEYDTAAANLLVDGAFNVNSTSVAAWEAVLRGAQGLPIAYWDPVGDALHSNQSNSSSPYPRNRVPTGGSTERWRGYRALEDDGSGSTAGELRDLAVEIVKMVRERGPFLSMADFVNRDIEAPSASDENLKGALQSAIDTTDINDDLATPAVQESTRLQYPEAGAGPRSTAAPGFLTQADLLQMLGPTLTVRSDTFVIRAYGDVWNAQTNEADAEAWCELVVQRMPEFTNPKEDSSEAWPPTGQSNLDFGRRFQVISFRWLDAEEVGSQQI